jgi:hypothetical protein
MTLQNLHSSTIFSYIFPRLLIRSASTTFHTAGVDDFSSVYNAMILLYIPRFGKRGGAAVNPWFAASEEMFRPKPQYE